MAGLHVLAIIMASVALATPPSEGVRVVRAADDTVWVEMRAQRVPVAVSKLEKIDTVRVMLASPVRLVTAFDRVDVPISRTPTLFSFATPRDTALIWFFHSAEEPDSAKLALLRNSARFGHKRPAAPVEFSYARSTDSSLALLGAQYDLDSVAGSGDDLSRIERLMHWVHARVRHDGNHGNPMPMNSLHLLDVAAREGMTCNCRGLGTILNEAYLSLGYRSRLVTCLPADTSDSDCHVVDMVWLPRESRWVLMDPTHDAWFTDRRGRVLGPAEVRAAMVRGDSLRVGGNLDWNGEPVERAHYLNYMAKNLYRFSSPLVSAFGYESSSGRPWEVYLEPSDYRPPRLGTIDKTSINGTVDVFTDDAAFFWARP